jgi:predicted enzyme related to lactoylglutathione lyase
MLFFYRDLLGFEASYLEEGACAFLRLPNNQSPQIAIYRGRELHTTDENHWFIVVDVDDIELVVARLKEVGVEVGRIQDVPHGRAAKFKDPEGNVVEVHQLTRNV